MWCDLLAMAVNTPTMGSENMVTCEEGGGGGRGAGGGEAEGGMGGREKQGHYCVTYC